MNISDHSLRDRETSKFSRYLFSQSIISTPVLRLRRHWVGTRPMRPFAPCPRWSFEQSRNTAEGRVRRLRSTVPTNNRLFPHYPREERRDKLCSELRSTPQAVPRDFGHRPSGTKFLLGARSVRSIAANSWPTIAAPRRVQTQDNFFSLPAHRGTGRIIAVAGSFGHPTRHKLATASPHLQTDAPKKWAVPVFGAAQAIRFFTKRWRSGGTGCSRGSIRGHG